MTSEKRVVRLFGVVLGNNIDEEPIDNNNVIDLSLALSPSPEAADMVHNVLPLRAVPPQESHENIPRNLLEAVERLSGERTNLLLLARKKLEGSDLKASLNRLFIPRTRAMVEALNEGEKAVLGIEVDEKPKKRKREDDQENVDEDHENEKKKKKKVMNKREGVQVSVVDPSGRVYSKMKFKKWPSLDQPVLVTEWKNFVADNGLEREDTVVVYSFRGRDGNLCFAMDVQRKEQKN